MSGIFVVIISDEGVVISVCKVISVFGEQVGPEHAKAASVILDISSASGDFSFDVDVMMSSDDPMVDCSSTEDGVVISSGTHLSDPQSLGFISTVDVSNSDVVIMSGDCVTDSDTMTSAVVVASSVSENCVEIIFGEPVV
jgi:hypothetical protein